MAPDLNSVPSSPRNNPLSSRSHSPPTSRRPSQPMTGTPLLPGVTSSNTVSQDTTHVPVRHPRPLTAAELHLELEKEQEAVVNRLTRELSALRAQNSASVVSTTSSHSGVDQPPTGAVSTDNPSSVSTQTQGVYESMYSRQRSSSSLSSRSNRSVTSLPATTPGVAAPATATSQASVDRARDAAGVGVGVSAGYRSRENSLAGMSLVMPSRSRAPSASPHPSPLLQNQGYYGGPGASVGGDPTMAYFPSHRQSMSSTSSASQRYEEAATARASLEVARKENEMLATRVRELEGLLRGRQGSHRRGETAGVETRGVEGRRSTEAENKITTGEHASGVTGG